MCHPESKTDLAILVFAKAELLTFPMNKAQLISSIDRLHMKPPTQGRHGDGKLAFGF
jgi:hypothetical protein